MYRPGHPASGSLTSYHHHHGRDSSLYLGIFCSINSQISILGQYSSISITQSCISGLKKRMEEHKMIV